ncbi:MAG: hypothetical protein IT266_04930 [Saprospiraceae bacterium]|nr:hypothetical protein [Saprospiraceae bacterium]
MKKIALLFSVIFLAATVHGQKVYAWWDAGVRLGYGMTGLINTNIIDDKNYEHHISTGYSLGGKFGMFFGLYNGVTLEGNIATYNQDFDFFRDNKTYDHSIKWKTIDLAMLYRNQRNGVYVELGPQLSLVNKVTQVDQFDPENKDVSDFYRKNYISGVFGIGGYIFNRENFTTMLGLRLGYSFTDMVNEDGKNAGYPTPSKDPAYGSYKTTNPAFVQLNLEFNFALGYYGRSSCSKRASLFKM